jgi:hypothetical protein
MSDDLVERVVHAFMQYELSRQHLDRHGFAKAAIAIALEEAARVADENACDCCFYIAAAIRALINNGEK